MLRYSVTLSPFIKGLINYLKIMEKISGENYKQALAEYKAGLGEYREKYRELDRKRQILMLKHSKLALLRERRLEEVLEEKGLGLCSVELGASFFRCGKHKGEAVLTGLKRLGIFEEEELSLVYFQTYIYHRGGHYEGSGYRYHEGIYQICSFHLQMPIEKVFLVPSLYPFPPHLPPNFEPITALPESPDFIGGGEGEARFQDSADNAGEALESLKYKKTADFHPRKLISKVVKNKEGVFIDKEDKILSADLYNTGVWGGTPEGIFRQFKIYPLPKEPEED
ncbi:MAG: hypothetical protein C4584_01025 [Armatimonadetes bacterium]|nr:MAG: hypothetical protein C4584_01025 [Armatimonadota bacterium]